MAEKSKKTVWTVLAVLAGVGLVVCLGLLLRPEAAAVPQPEGRPVSQAVSASEPAASTPEVSQAPESEPQPVVMPERYKQLRADYPDIYALLEMEATAIDYPVLQRAGADDYYLRKDLDGNYAVAGSLFTEGSYNTTDFSDPVTIIYGHDMADGSMFGSLQPYCETMALDEDALFYIYQPDRRLTYQIFAAVPYDNSHILYYNDFSNEQVFENFFADIFATRSFHANLAPELGPEPGDRVVILSTCLRGDPTYTERFLVMGVLIEDTAALSS